MTLNAIIAHARGLSITSKEGANNVYVGRIHWAFEPLFLANLLTGYIYRRFGFLSAVVLRLSFYAVWHVAYGGFRPFWLSL